MENMIPLLGYLAAVFVLFSLSMKTMVPLRLFSIASNIASIFYAYFTTPHLYPILILHSYLLPLNVYRLWQIKRFMEEVKKFSEAGVSFDFLIPFMTEEHFSKGDVLFRKGDHSDKLYLISKGRVELPEMQKTLQSGEVLGEIGVLTSKKNRTASARCLDDVVVLSIPETQIMALCYQNPKFGFYLSQVAIRRFESALL